jgi:hypothetical protein
MRRTMDAPPHLLESSSLESLNPAGWADPERLAPGLWSCRIRGQRFNIPQAPFLDRN